MKHRFWFVFLAVCLLLSVGALAADRDSETGITYTIENGEATIVKCDFTGKTLEIPASLGGCPVREIGSRAFFDMKSLEDVTIPNTVQRIGDHAFSESFFLKSVTLPSSVTERGMGVFASCDWLQQADLSALRITRLPDGTFRDCGRLVTVQLPDTLTALGDRCFYETRDLMRLSLPRGLTTFGRECFAVNCGLESFAFPAGTTKIPEGCFYQCSRLKSVTLPETVRRLTTTYRATLDQMLQQFSGIPEFDNAISDIPSDNDELAALAYEAFGNTLEKVVFTSAEGNENLKGAAEVILQQLKTDCAKACDLIFDNQNADTRAFLTTIFQLMVMEKAEPMVKSMLSDVSFLGTVDENQTDDLYLTIRLTDDQSGIHAISPDEENASATVYTITGMPVSGNTSTLPKGIYVKRQGNSVKKVLVK